MTARARDSHLNLIESSRRLFELDPGAEIEDGNGWMFGAGRSTHPVISNAAFRREDGIAADGLIERARSFFGARGRGFAVWARAGEPADDDLVAACEAAGLQMVYAMPAMVLNGRAEERPSPEGIVLRRVASEGDVEDYWRVAASSYVSPMGESLYRRMGFETIYDYRLYLCQPPEGKR